MLVIFGSEAFFQENMLAGLLTYFHLLIKFAQKFQVLIILNTPTDSPAKFSSGGVTDYIRNIIIASTILITIGVTAMVSFQYVTLFRRVSLQQRENLIGKQKEFIKDLIASEMDYITGEKVQFDSRVAEELSKNVCYAYAIASKIYSEYKEEMPDEALIKIIVGLVSAMECSQPYAHVFINDLDGKGIFYAGNPGRSDVNLINSQDAQGNFVVRKELDLLKRVDEGFIWYDPINKKGDDKPVMGKKISFVKKFEPLRLYFGSKCYLEDYYEDFKNEIAKKICSERFRYGGYVFLNELSGKPVVFDGQIYHGKFNYFDGSDTSKMNVYKRVVAVAKSSHEGGYLSYQWNKMGETEKKAKISYVRYFAGSDWIVGAGFYEDEIDAELIIQRKDLKRGIVKNLLTIFLVLLLVLGVEILLLYRFSENYQADFSHFKDFFQTGKGKYEKIDIDRLHFSEFRGIGVVANEMIEERARIHEQLVHEQKKALESDRLKTAFLANMSHEIRTPMNAIIGFSQLIDDESVSREDRKVFLQLILQNGELLMNLINDIIDIAKIESGQLNVLKRKFSLDSLLDNISIYYQEYISSRPELNVTFCMERNLPGQFYCYSDQFRLKQVLDNLVGNAIKFTASGTIKLAVSEADGKIYFSVQDTGIGISPGDQEIIFNRFMQAKDHLRKNYGGTGLGLAISKNIVEQLGGEIGVRSVPGAGSEFYFYIISHCPDGPAATGPQQA